MRRHFILALLSSASLGLLSAAGCSSSDDPGGGPTPDSGSPDAPGNPRDDADGKPDADAAPPGDSGPHAPGWDPDFSLPGIGGRLAPTVNAMARVQARQIVVAGNFEQAGSVSTKFVALWNGDKWLSISSGLTRGIEELVATPTGELYGSTRESDNTWKIYKWNKTTWSEFAAFDSEIRSMEVAPDGKLYVAGSFTRIGAASIANAAVFDGMGWSALAGAPENILAIRVLGTKVCVGLGYGLAGVSCLEGGTWSAKSFAPDTYGNVKDITEQNGQLIAVGQFRVSPDDPGGSIARWNGSSWDLVGGGVEGIGPADVRDVQVDGTKIYVTGDIRFAGGQQVSHVVMFDTAQSRWFTLNDGVWGSSGGAGFGDAPGRVLVIDQGGEIYVGGRFSLIGGRNALGVARWDGNQWNPVDDPKEKRLGVNGGVSTITGDTAGTIYIGGSFEFTGGDVPAAYVARFKNDAWSTMGAGFDTSVRTIVASGGTVYAGGAFNKSGPAVTRRVAKWDGANWGPLGTGLDYDVKALAVGPDGKLYAGGGFRLAGSVPVEHVAVWDGTSWKPLGDGFDDDVDALAFDATGKLYAGGTFRHSGKTDVKAIAAWNGTSWSQVGAGVERSIGASVSAIVFYEDKLTIGGAFEKSGTTKIDSLATWDGTAWAPLAGGARGNWGAAHVNGLAVHGKELYIGGIIANVGVAVPDAGAGKEVANIAMWNGTEWSDLGTGLTDLASTVYATNDALWMGGSFTFAGNQSSYRIARYWFKP